ncbi:MAG: DsbA family oxidoreductase [Loktanella sp.]|jgi:predicted DsbA family dithiol-disulfide isomerase|nr:DsbA family oxidoreductase [Loktanella sp.]MDO7624151.1 DsbA family oxidoreductase [Loktanella sp.]MDO7625885.1 DsbA family oxidoreductase [Loktanella sp.]MDO7631769.1 DsbA family oxidoreductase [Loktanella sp.]MDO7666096.1 DsbA family oxidoreductase [Loktanella sp.]
MTKTLRIDIISDVMCPWCIVGYRQLSAALEATGTAHEIHWHPFELNPDMPPEGQNLREHIMQKYGSSLEESEQSRQHLKTLGSDLGIDFQFSDGSRMHNTFNTHQLLHWANTQERMHDLKQALFIAHFTNARDLSDNAVLADIAGEIGLDRTEALAVLDDQRYASQIRQEENFWTKQGIRGVPAVVFDRQHLVTGAQGVDNFTSILKQLAEETA